MKAFIKFIIAVIFGTDDKSMISEGFISYEGQGRDKYGK